MKYKNFKVITEDGTTYLFSKNETLKLITFNGTDFYERNIVENSISEIKEGNQLKLQYYVGKFIQTLESATAIAAIESL